MTEEDIAAYKAELAAERKRQRLRREEEKQWRREQEKEDSYWLTACQCLENGYIPNRNTPVLLGECLFWKGSSYFYYDTRKCEYNKDKAAELADTFPISTYRLVYLVSPNYNNCWRLRRLILI